MHDPIENESEAALTGDAYGRSGAGPSDFSGVTRLLMLVVNFLPLLHAALVVACLVSTGHALWGRCAVAISVLYLLPPVAGRIVKLFLPVREGRLRIGGKEFFSWWVQASLQTVFCRLPFLEEMLRLVPGLYSQWLRLWGSKIGRLTYWAPGTTILDRSLLSIGDDVIFGAGVRLNPHVIARRPDGEMELMLGTVKIGNGAMVGGYSLLTAGTEVADHECLRACRVSVPFAKWQNGGRQKENFEESAGADM